MILAAFGGFEPNRRLSLVGYMYVLVKGEAVDAWI